MSETKKIFLSEPMVVVIDDERFTVVNPVKTVQVPVWERPDWKAFTERHAHKFTDHRLSFLMQTRQKSSDWPMERFIFWKMCRDRMDHVLSECEQLFGAPI
jgi:hypothetical protein